MYTSRVKYIFMTVALVVGSWLLFKFIDLNLKISQAETELKVHEDRFTSLKNYASTLHLTIEEPFRITEPRNLLVVAVYSKDSVQDPSKNLEFFLAHGIFDDADFLFVDNGGKVEVKIPEDKMNVFQWKRENTCYHIGTFPLAVDYMKQKNGKNYDKYIFLNLSVRGPFIPAWSKTCWADAFVGPKNLNNGTKLCGVSYVCKPVEERRLQSMVWGTDRIGYEIIKPLMTCPSSYAEVEKIEAKVTKAIYDNGYNVTATMAAFHMKNYVQTCDHGDVHVGGQYYGGNFQPYEVVFVRTNRQVDDASIERYTRFSNEMSYDSNKNCAIKKK